MPRQQLRAASRSPTAQHVTRCCQLLCWHTWAVQRGRRTAAAHTHLGAGLITTSRTLDRLPLLVVALAREVDWQSEDACFTSVCAVSLPVPARLWLQPDWPTALGC